MRSPVRWRGLARDSSARVAGDARQRVCAGLSAMRAARKRSILAALGIDVYVRRDAASRACRRRARVPTSRPPQPGATPARSAPQASPAASTGTRCARRSPAARAARCTRRAPRPCSASATATRAGWSSARRRAPRRTGRASRSSAAPGSCSMRCCARSACRARRCSSPTSSSAGRRATATRGRRKCARCLPYLSARSSCVKPTLILRRRAHRRAEPARDRHAARQLRGKLHSLRRANSPLVVTYHPAYLLRSPGEKRKAWEDLKFARATFARARARAGRRVSAARSTLPGRAAMVHFRPMVAERPAGSRRGRARVYAFPWSEGIFRDCLRVGYLCRVVELGGEIVGYGIMAWARARRTSSTSASATTCAARGVGRRLLELLLERARPAGMREAFLEVRPSNPLAIALYQRSASSRSACGAATTRPRTAAKTPWCSSSARAALTPVRG